MNSTAEKLERVREQIAQAAAKVGRAVDEIELVAISKTHDAAKVREGSKFGFQPDKLRAEMESLLALPRLSILGLMTIPPIAEEAEASRKYFVQLRELRARVQTEFHVDLAQLSMGMTQDFAVAVEEGATLVRVGTAIFGERSKRQKD